MAASIHDFAFDYEQFDWAHLRAVIPVAQAMPLGDMTLALMSLELYEAGFAANLLFEQVAEPPPPERPDPEGPTLFRGMAAIAAHDDQGTRYEGRPRSGYGGGSVTASQMHNVYNFAPALHPDAQRLTLDVLFVTRLGWNIEGEPQWGAEDVVAGPLSVTFIIPERT